MSEREEVDLYLTAPFNNHIDVDTLERIARTPRLSWEDIRLCVSKANGEKATILNGVWGESPQGQISAIMGPSGSGKTSLLNVLSGRMTNSTANVTVQADCVTFNGRKLNVTNLTTRQAFAFVAQDDSLSITSTPREAIMFSARLRLDKDKTNEELVAITEKMLAQLHLEECADTAVGGMLLKGISGGERKRTSVGVELVCKPKLVFLDEPTSGLDSFNARELVNVLKIVAKEECSSIILTIHQPSSDIWELFDRVTLLKLGRVMYEGSRANVNEKFAACGYPLPPNYNPADWIMTVAQTISTEQLESAGFFPVKNISNDGMNVGLATEDWMMVSSVPLSKRVGFTIQTKWLLQRDVQDFKRNTHPLKTRTAMTLIISSLVGFLFFGAATKDYSSFVNLQTAFGSLVLCLISMITSTTIPMLVSFPEDRPVFLREYSTACYSVSAYFVSRFTLEIVVTAVQVTVATLITYFMVGYSMSYGLFWAVTYMMALTSTAIAAMLGSTVSDPSVAIELLSAVIIPQILFSGYVIPEANMPEWLTWLTYLFPLNYAVKLVLLFEFENACEGNFINFCSTLLTSINVNADEEWWYWCVLVAQFIFFRLMALWFLHLKAKTFY